MLSRTLAVRGMVQILLNSYHHSMMVEQLTS